MLVVIVVLAREIPHDAPQRGEAATQERKAVSRIVTEGQKIVEKRVDFGD
jgi:hypothetical protein